MKKAVLAKTGERPEIGYWQPAPFLKKKKPGFLWRCCATKIPADSHMIIFWKLSKKAVPFLKFCPKPKRALLIFHSNRGYRLLSLGDIYSQRNDIYEIRKNCVNISPKKSEQFLNDNIQIKWNVHYKLNFLQLISIVYTTNGSPCWTRTNDLRINSPSLYRLS